MLNDVKYRFLLLFCLIQMSVQGQSYVMQFEDSEQAQAYFNKDSEMIFSVKKLAKSYDIYAVHYKVELKSTKEIAGLINLEQVAKTETRSTPNDPLYESMWPLKIIEAEKAWDQVTHGATANGTEIVIAILDDQIDYRHNDLINNIWTNKGEIPNDGIDNDGNGYIDDYYGLHIDSGDDKHPFGSHGTKVAGVIGAEGNNNLGITGINWNIKMMILSGTDNSSDIIEGYMYALEQRKLFNESNGAEGAFVVATNLSAGISRTFGFSFPLWCEAYELLGEQGILSVTATDNESYDVDIEGDMPSTCQSNSLIVVTSTTRFDTKAATGAFGINNIDLGAPGEDTFSTSPDDNYSEFTGTSAACPHVAGAIGLMYAVKCDSIADIFMNQPALAAATVKESILRNVDPLEDLNFRSVTGGRLNLFESMKGLTDFCQNSSPNQGEQLKIVSIGPNPTQDLLRFEYAFANFDNHEIKIYDSAGRLVIKNVITPSIFSASIAEIDVSALTKGIYYLVLDNDGDFVTTSFYKG